MSYLVIDKNGTEKISRKKPQRWGCFKIGKVYLLANKKTIKKLPKEDCYFWQAPNDEIINLEKGSIKKLIGISLNWGNEPFRI